MSARLLHKINFGLARHAACLVACCLFAGVLPPRAVAVQFDPEQILRLSIASTEADWKATPEFSYIECDEDGKGNNKTSKTYKVLMLDGSPYSRLIAVGNRPLSPAQDAAENAKLQKEAARRYHEAPAQRLRRLQQYQKERGRMFALLHQMTQALNFKLRGEQKLDGREVYVFDALPRPGYQPPNRETRVLTGMKGTLWIDKQSHRWVKVEAEAIKPVWFGWFIAKVLPGTRFLLEQDPVVTGAWLPEHFSFEARVRFLGWPKDFSHSETYHDYRLNSTPPAL